MIARLITHSAHKIAIPGPSFWGFAFAMFCMSLCHTAGAQPSPQPKGQVAPYPAAKDPTKKAAGKVPPLPGSKGKEEKPPQEVPVKQAAPVQNTKKAKPSPTSGKLAFLLEIKDPSGLMQSAPQIVAKSTKGKSFIGVIKDDGKPPDQALGDKTYTGPIHNVDGANLTSILVTSGDLKWLIEVELNEGVGADRIIIQLKEKGKASYNFKARGAASAGGVAPSNTTPGEAPKPTPSKAATSKKKKKAKWPLIIAASTAGVLICIVLILRRRNRSQMLELEGGVATGVFPPRRLEAEQIAKLLAGPLVGHRVVLLGDLQVPASGIIRCLSKYPLPNKLVRSIEHLAVTPGLPLALLVTDPDRLARANAMDPVDMLAEQVDGRFPLWVVDGFEDWEALEDALSHKEAAKEE